MGEYCIDFKRYFTLLWRRRKVVAGIVAFFTLLGFIFAVTTPASYSVTTIIVPQVSSKLSTASSKVGSLANIAGISLGTIPLNDGELSPLVYPQIFNSVALKRELLHSKFTIEGVDTLVSLYEYYTNPEYSKFNLGEFIKGWSIGLPSKIRALLRRDGDSANLGSGEDSLFISLTAKESELMSSLSERLIMDVDNGNGYIKISATMGEPRLAAEVVARLSELMQSYITGFKLEKARDGLAFISNQYCEARQLYDSLSVEWANYADANRAFNSEGSRVRREQLRDNYMMARDRFWQLASQKIVAEMQLSEDTPVFSIIQPPYIPYEKSSPSKMKVLMMWILTGVVAGCGWVIAKDWYSSNIAGLWRNVVEK
ncbi:MAG: hypothetical protein J6K74_00565 [Marinifilaceae bacterium]|nr:hypothetical protein [Marinifilaceae bacterium]